MKNILIQTLSVLLLFIVFDGKAQLVKPFTQRTSPSNPGVTIYNLKGDFTMIGNTNLTLQNYGDNTGNNNSMVFVDIDGDATTLNSSSSYLSLTGGSGGSAQCSEVVYAGLYWTGRAHNSTTSPNEFSVTKGGLTSILNKQIVKIKGPNASSYSTVTATNTDIYYPENSDGFMYSSYAEVTQYVQNNGTEGLYTIADIALNEGNGGGTGFYGGWGMVVIYGNSSMALRDITVFDGHAYVAGNITADFTIPVSGFNSTQSGPVNVKMGMMAGEGDRTISGDYFQIRDAANTSWVNLNHSGNSSNNFFNSSIATGGNTRIPNLLNNTGLDICMFNIPNANNSIITNNQSSTTFRYGTTQDTYIIYSIVFAVDAYQPDIVGINTLETVNNAPATSSPTVEPGEELGYTLEVFNYGNEPIENGQVIIPIPYNASFANASGSFLFTPNNNANPYYDPTIGANGSIVWNVGNLPVPSTQNTVLAQLNYTLSATEDCFLLANTTCDNVIEVNGTITGVGSITGTTLSKTFISGFEETGSCAGSPITLPLAVPILGEQFVKENCGDIQTSYSFIFCGLGSSPVIQTNQISGSFPVGTRFFDTNPVSTSSIEYTNTGFPTISGTTTYFAYPQGTESPCSIELNITVIDSVITAVPSTNDVVYCLNEVAVPLTANPSNNENSIYYYSQFPGGSPSGQITPTTTVAGNFTYYAVEAISNNCISSNSAPINVTVYSPGTATLSGINGTEEYSATISGGTELCFEVFVDNSQTNQPIILSYNNGIEGASFTPEENGLSGTFCWAPSNNDSGSFTFQVLVSDNCGGMQSYTYEIIVESSPCDVVVTVDNFSNVTCSENDGTAQITASGGVAPYTYTLINNITGEVFSNTNGTFTDLTVGEYDVYVTDANNCQPICSNLSFEVNGTFNPLSADIVATNDPCALSGSNGGTITINTQGGTPGYLYSIGNGFQSDNVFNGLSNGDYSINIIDANGCSFNTTATVSSSTPLSLTVSNVSADNCGLNTGSFTVAVSGGNAPYALAMNGQQVNEGIIQNLGAGQYQITVSDVNNCTFTETVVIGSPTSLSSSIINVVQPNCLISSGSFEVSVSGGTGPYTFTLGSSESSNNAFNNLSAGNYTLITTDANGCESISNVEIIAPISLSAQIENLTDATCGLSNGEFMVSILEGTAPYAYTLNGLSVEGSTFSGLSEGAYSLTVTDANLCSQSFNVDINGTSAFSISAVANNATCNSACDGSIVLSSSEENINYSWSNGQTGSQIENLCAGTYDVEAINENGCIQELTVSISEPAVLTLTLSGTTNSNCNESNGSAVLIAQGGTAPYMYSIAGSSQSSVISNNTGNFNDLSAGSYAYYVSDANNCQIECVQLFFITNDCVGQNSAGGNRQILTTNQTQLLVSSNTEKNSYLVNYSVDFEDGMKMVFIDQSGGVVQEIILNKASGKFEITGIAPEKKCAFVILENEKGKIVATTKVK